MMDEVHESQALLLEEAAADKALAGSTGTGGSSPATQVRAGCGVASERHAPVAWREPVAPVAPRAGIQAAAGDEEAMVGLPLLAPGGGLNPVEWDPKRMARPGSAWAPLAYSLLCMLACVTYGFTLGLTAPMGTVLQQGRNASGLGLTEAQADLFGSIVNGGALVGALGGSKLLDVLGRARTVTLLCVPFSVGFVLIAVAQSLGVLLAGRVLTGVAVGLTAVTVPVYVSELAPVRLRGSLGGLFQVAISFGLLLVCALGMVVRDWRHLAFLGAVPSTLLLLLSWPLLPRTPQFLLMTQRESKALDTLRRLRGDDPAAIMAELNVIRVGLLCSRKAAANAGEANPEAPGASLSALVRPAPRRALLVAALVMLVQQFSGINAIAFYTPEVFATARVHGAQLLAVIVCVARLAGSFLPCLLLDRAGRRVLMIGPAIGMAAAMTVLGYFYHQEAAAAGAGSGSVAVGAIVVYVFCFSAGLGVVPWLLMSEMFGAEVRATAAGVITVLNWTLSFTVTETFPLMLESPLGPSGTFWLYAAVCLVAVAVVIVMVPETRGRAMPDIQAHFAGRPLLQPLDFKTGRSLAYGLGLAAVVAVAGTILGMAYGVL